MRKLAIAMWLSALVAHAGATIPFEDGWRFLKADTPGAEKPDFDDAKWRIVSVPHDWSIEGPFDQPTPPAQAEGFCRLEWVGTGSILLPARTARWWSSTA